MHKMIYKVEILHMGEIDDIGFVAPDKFAGQRLQQAFERILSGLVCPGGSHKRKISALRADIQQRIQRKPDMDIF